MNELSPCSLLSRLLQRSHGAASKAVFSLATVLAVGPVAAQGPFQLQLNDGSGAEPGSVLVTERNFGTIDMACDVGMAGGWYEVVYDCDALPSISELLPRSTPYGPVLASFFGTTSAAGTALAEQAGRELPVRSGVVVTALERALKDGSGSLSTSAISNAWEGIDSQSMHFQPSSGIYVVFQNYTGLNNPLMFRGGWGNQLHFEAMRQYAIWERVSGLIIGSDLVDPGDLTGMTPEQANRAWKEAFFNHGIYTGFLRHGMRLRLAAIYLRGRAVDPLPQPPAPLLGMPGHAPKSRLSGPAVVTFSPSTVPQIEPNGEVMLPGTVTKIVEPGGTLSYRQGGYAPGMRLALQQIQGGTARYEVALRWVDFGMTAFTLPSSMNLGRYKIVEARHRLVDANGTVTWTPWQELSHQREILVSMTGSMGN